MEEKSSNRIEDIIRPAYSVNEKKDRRSAPKFSG